MDAAFQLMAERGIEGTSMDAIAEASGVSKATIYKHWADKDALVLESIGRAYGLDREPMRFDSGDLLQDLIAFLKHRPPEFARLRDRLAPQIIAYAGVNTRFGIAWKSKVLDPGRAQAMELIRRGIDNGLLRPDLDASLAVALLLGPLIYAHITRLTPERPEDLPEGVARAFWRAFAVQPPPERRRV